MAFIKHKPIDDMVGCWYILKEPVSTMIGTFEAGTRVKVTDTYPRGHYICFSFEDIDGNTAHDVPGRAFVIEDEDGRVI